MEKIKQRQKTKKHQSSQHFSKKEAGRGSKRMPVITTLEESKKKNGKHQIKPFSLGN